LRLHKPIAALSGLMLAGAAWAGETTVEQVREQIVRASVASYSGSCACPYSNDAAGDPCGARSAWSKKGGKTIVCFAHEVTDEQVRQFRQRY
jgi:hypothetical protein